MARRALILMVMALGGGGLSACASARADAPLGGAIRRPVVNDPAPIVRGTMRPYQIRGRWYHPAEQPNYQETGLASWYGDAFHGRPTATGEIFDMNAMTAAHKTLPLPGLVEVTNLANGRTVILRVNDRGPFVDGRIIDLSRGAASELGLLNQGVGEVRVRYLGPAPRGGGTGAEPRAYAEARPQIQPPQPPQSSPASRQGDFWVQAGAFADERGAHRTARRLGESATVQPVESDGRRLYRVVVGPWPDADAAEQARLAVAARGFPDALLISGR